MTLSMLDKIVDEIECSVGEVEWRIHRDVLGDGYYIQLRYEEPDIFTGKMEDQHARKWYISSHVTREEVVQTVLKACLTSAEHMVREHFLYQGKRVFGPHLNLDNLMEIADQTEERMAA